MDNHDTNPRENYPEQNHPQQKQAPGSSYQWNIDLPAKLHSQTVGKRGPILKQDNIEHETLQTFIHEKMKERPVHVKGWGAFGQFETLYSMSNYTSLSFLQQPGTRVPVFVRFSLAVSTKGTPDTSRNVRGFSTKFYTEEGIFDLICNHIPVFSVRDTIRFPEAIKAFLPSPKSNLIDPSRYWNFVARAPESLLFTLLVYSNLGTVKSLRHLPGYSVNTYVWKNAEGKRHYVKYTWSPLAGQQYIRNDEAVKLAGENPDIAGQDLYNAIEKGEQVEYGLYVQVIDPDKAAGLPYDPLDATKIWDQQQFPFHPVGRMVLNKNPDNYMEQVEKAAFSPSNLLNGVELSDDKMLQGRANVYWDSQRNRIGSDFRNVPVNHQADWWPGDLVTSGNGRLVEGILQRSDLEKQDDFTQAGLFYESLSEDQQNDLIENMAPGLATVSSNVYNLVLQYMNNASNDLASKLNKSVTMKREG
ncbi:catalase [Heyndrickxia oleronia]|uniref:catalase n=1 Tax=Heyndrickxia oleronia TaxID=38875 RepID=UPI001B12DB14|nr:catalase [Heyndrickxia oleronia]GIN41310.1 catalase [Heyndrickxia oleronia]